MIKIENNGIDDIADEYFSFVENKIESGKTLTQQYYYHHRRDFILCRVDDFPNKIAEFEKECSNDLLDYKKASQLYKNCHNKKNKARLKEKLDQTAFVQFRHYMEWQYKRIFQILIANPFAPKEKTKFGFLLARKLDIKTCPYCNRQYTFTIDENCSIRPEFDHFYPKSKYPYFALSFYNLIPCCPICNHVKKENLIDLNPYKEGFGDNYKFEIDMDEFFTKDQVSSIKFNNYNQNIDTFGLEKLYNGHLDYINEILFKAKAYNRDYYGGLIDSFHSIGVQTEEINRYIWGCYLDTAEHVKRPLSKLTKDLLEQIGIDIL